VFPHFRLGSCAGGDSSVRDCSFDCGADHVWADGSLLAVLGAGFLAVNFYHGRTLDGASNAAIGSKTGSGMRAFYFFGISVYLRDAGDGGCFTPPEGNSPEKCWKRSAGPLSRSGDPQVQAAFETLKTQKNRRHAGVRAGGCSFSPESAAGSLPER